MRMRLDSSGGNPAANLAQRPPGWVPEREFGRNAWLHKPSRPASERITVIAWAPGMQERSGVLCAAVGGWETSCLRAVRCEAVHALLEEGSGGLRGLPGMGPYISCRPAGGISWVVAHGVASAASYLEMKGRHCWALEGARQCLCREGSGLAASCRAEPGMGENTEGRAGGLAGGPADYACSSMTEPRGLSWSALQWSALAYYNAITSKMYEVLDQITRILTEKMVVFFRRLFLGSTEQYTTPNVSSRD